MVTQHIVATPPKQSIFMVLVINDGAEEQARAALTEISGLTRSVGFRVPDAQLLAVIGIGSQAWDRLFPGEHRPEHLHPFRELHGQKHSAPRTPGDLLFHLRGGSEEVCFELARLLTRRFAGIAEIVDEVHAFKYFDERDILGFVDGTENPEGQEAYDAVLITDDPDARFNGGSYVLTQKYTHDMSAWESTTVEEQERIIGRTKADNIEFPDDAKPANAHIALNDITDADGNGLDILRYNMVFGEFSQGTLGTYFIGYAKDPAVIEKMLENMFIGNPVGNYDRILDFSTPHTGGLFYVPSDELLDRFDTFGKSSGRPHGRFPR